MKETEAMASNIVESESPDPATVGSAAGAPTREELIERFGRDIFNDFDFNDPGFNEQINEVLDEQLKHCPAVRSQVGEGLLVVRPQCRR